MTEIIALRRDGQAAARRALERCVAAGGVAIFPADGLYGLACDPLDAVAIARIHRIKGRERGKPSAVMYFSPLAMREIIESLSPRTRAVVGALLPGPVTLIIANPDHRYPLACGDDPGRLGVRLIEGPLSGAMCPVLQTSANRSGEPAPSRFELLDPAVVDGADLAIDGAGLTGSPSTVVDISRIEEGGGWAVLREGGLGADALRSALAGATGSADPPG